jgi:murein DD-endopeptidase MepM/ murein hydrolase activator NlpD
MQYSIKNLPQLLTQHSASYACIVPHNLNAPHVHILNLTTSNQNLTQIDLADTISFEKFIWREMEKTGALIAVGGYNEDRIIYKRSEHFNGQENRSIHLGIDIWAKAGTPVFSPLAGKIHSFQDNAGFGNYGPTIILKHQLENSTFYTLYGHLSVSSISNCKAGQFVETGQQIGSLGNYPENGDWPPHLHFQVISQLNGWFGDFPGVAAPSEREYYLQLCPDPNLILQIKSLQI